MAEELTDRKEAALAEALAGRFEERPHGATGEALAATRDTSTATFHQHLRIAETKLDEIFVSE